MNEIIEYPDRLYLLIKMGDIFVLDRGFRNVLLVFKKRYIAVKHI